MKEWVGARKRNMYAPQARQDRQRDRPVRERQRDDDRGDDEVVATGQLLVARATVNDPS